MKLILIIEDEDAMRRNLETILAMEGYRVLATDDGDDGVALALKEGPDLILCDVMMHGIDGYSVLQKLREDEKAAAIPFIFLTAKGTKKEQRSGMDLGADDYLVKPVTVSDILSAIAARLNRQEVLVRGLKCDRSPDFSSAKPLESLGLTAREAEVLLWVTQGKSNADVGSILDMTENTVKKHLQNVYAKLGLESRNAAALRAIEVLNGATSEATLGE